ncbi:hypothetical protein C4580_04215 [Candidatus Woesearchaeota archaeon]|nr:MAG: hypothetical protein C4580_04215 [Candidatus Woesearchaeota archaeon]
MSDERLRKLERETAQGDPAARARLLEERLRTQDPAVWQEFTALFDAVELQPWNQNAVRALKNFCEKITPTPFAQWQPRQKNAKVPPGTYDSDNLFGGNENIIITEGTFTGVGQFNRCERIVVLGGTFTVGSFDGSTHLIIMGGTLRSTFDRNTQHITIIGGTFTDQIHLAAYDVVVTGGRFVHAPQGQHITLLGGTYQESRFATTGSVDARIWLPRQLIAWPAIPHDAKIVALGIQSLGVDRTWRSLDLSFQAGMGYPRTPHTAFYLKTCPEQRDVSPEFRHLIFTAKTIPEIIPILRANPSVNRKNLWRFFDTQIAAIQQNAQRCFND